MSGLIMSADKNTGTPVENLETWLYNKPYWEQYVWKLNFEKDSLTDDDIGQCYDYLCEHLGLIAPVSGKKPTIAFKHEIIETPELAETQRKKKILEIKDFKNVNAISDNCSVKFGPNLTLIYGANGSGKSGVSRILCKACFSRGEREVLPNVKMVDSTPRPEPQAKFIINDGSESNSEIDYIVGDVYDDLKCFSVFDSKSVLIHLDESNHVNFTPSQIKIFDKVPQTISKLEEKLNNEKNVKRTNNPFQNMFLDNGDTSDIAAFCKGINSETNEAEFLELIYFDPETDNVLMEDIEKQIEEKRKLDIPLKKSQLASDRQNLAVLKSILEEVITFFTPAKMDETNQLIKDILEKKNIIAGLSVQSFDDGILSTIGSTEWKALIDAAKKLYEREKILNENREPDHCMLCHQRLTEDAEALFKKYWQLLESKAESELSQLIQKQSLLLHALTSAKVTYPKFLPTDAGVSILHEDDPNYLVRLKQQFGTLKEVLDNWITMIGNFQEIKCDNVPAIDLDNINSIIAKKEAEELKLVDPAKEIEKLQAQLNSMKHKKEATAVKDAALEYIIFLKWSAKAALVNFAGLKMAITKKRTESFLVSVVSNYTDIFNQELTQLGCDFNLVMLTSGEQGKTVKEYRLDFAEDYAPSQILSEGEQNACSFADLLTEVTLDKNNCGIIFDDPVSSLDHDRKDQIAARLTIEAERRQVIIFSHDIVFMSMLAKHAEKYRIPLVAHWMKQVNGIPGCVEDNCSPKLSSLAALKKDSEEAVRDFGSLGAKEQEQSLGAAFDYLRSACEALIEEVLFAEVIQRYDDQIRVQNLEEAIFDQELALKIVDLHGRLSEVLLAHNRSALMRERQSELADLTTFRKELEELEKKLKDSKKLAQKARKERKEAKIAAKAGW